MFQTKGLTDEQVLCLERVLEKEYQTMQENQDETDEVNEEWTVERVIKAQSDNFVQLVQQRIERMEVDLKKCVQYLADPVVDASVPFIYASVVTRFPPIIESKQNKRAIKRVILKKAHLGEEDPYSFQDWNLKPMLLTGEVCLIGSTIYSFLIKLCDSSFSTSDSPVLYTSSLQSVSLKQIQTIESLLLSFVTSIQTIPVQTISDCCSTLSSFLQFLFAIKDCFDGDIEEAQLIPLEKDYCVRFVINGGSLVTEVMQMRKAKQGMELLEVEGEKYRVLKSIKSEVSIEFYQSVFDIINKLIHDVLLLLANCRTVESAHESIVCFKVILMSALLSLKEKDGDCPSMSKEQKSVQKRQNRVIKESCDEPVYSTVGIRREYIAESNQDELQTNNQTNGCTKSYNLKRSKTEVGLKERHDYQTLCRFTALEQPCPFGSDCKFEHDVEAFFKRKEADIGDMCPVWKEHGYCPAGLNCRWALSHVSLPNYRLITKPENEQLPIVELNRGNEIATAIRKKVYHFEYSSWLEELKTNPIHPIGALADSEVRKLDFHGKVYIAPLTTVGNLPFRRICVDYGADITCSEMVMCGNLLKSQSSEWALLRRHPSETCFGVQLATGQVEDACAVCEIIRRDLNVDFVDFNTGCPIDSVGRTGAGAGLLMKVGRMKRIVGGMLSSLDCIPLLVKTRTGDHENTTHRLIPQLQALRGRTGARVEGVIIHGRTRQSRYTKTADWEYVKKCALNEDPSLPGMAFIGNGDIFDFRSYQQHLEDGILDGVMIGRGALTKPWICTEIKEKRIWDISASERLDMIHTFVNYGLEHWGSDAQGVDRTRRFLLEWLSFLCRYVPVGILERPQTMNQRPCHYIGRSELETLLGSRSPKDWIHISEMFLGPVDSGFTFIPKHRSNAYTEQ